MLLHAALLPAQTWLLNYLLNSLWQLPLLFAAAWLATRALSRHSPAAQHRIWVATLFLQLTLPAITLSPRQLLDTLTALNPWRAQSPTTALITITTGPAQAHSSLQLPALIITLILATYALTLAYFAARFLYGLRNTNVLRRNTQPIALTAEAAATFSRNAQHFNVPNAQLAESQAAPYPLTIGLRNPLILFPKGVLPTAMATTISTDDLSAALAHELAHIHRRDFAKNLAYAALSIPIAFHPILWLTRNRIADTREIICDALAAAALTGSEPYARSLLRLAARFAHATPNRNLQAIGIFDTTTFERRLMNLTQTPTKLRTLQRIALITTGLAIGLATCASALALRMTVSPTATPAPSEAPQAATPEPTKLIHINGGVIAGQRISFVPPIYPAEARAEKFSGTVKLRAVIGKDGKIAKLTVISGPEVFQKSALDAVSQWVYKPYLLNGEPVEVDTTITVNYALNGPSHPSSSTGTSSGSSSATGEGSSTSNGSSNGSGSATGTGNSSNSAAPSPDPTPTPTPQTSNPSSFK